MFAIANTFTKRVAGCTRTLNTIHPFINSLRTNRLFRAMSDRRVIVNPRASAVTIVKSPKHITVHPEGIGRLTEEVVKAIVSGELDVRNFSQHKHHPKATDAHAIEWIFVIDTLNFCFWTPGDAVKWKVEGETGYFALCAAINRALRNGIDITNAQYYSRITLEELTDILRADDGETKVPLLEDRVKCLHEVGSVLLEKYEGKFENVLKEADHSAQRLLRIVTEEFPCYRDEAEWGGIGVSLYKRAQILIGDLWACFQAKDHGYFEDIGTVTMFADYRVPQVLVHFGTLEYDDYLTDLLNSNKILDSGCAEEFEIRGASIYVVEELKKAVLSELQQNYPSVPKQNVNSILLDHFLWDYRRRYAADLEYNPFHKTVGIYY